MLEILHQIWCKYVAAILHVLERFEFFRDQGLSSSEFQCITKLATARLLNISRPSTQMADMNINYTFTRETLIAML